MKTEKEKVGDAKPTRAAGIGFGVLRETTTILALALGHSRAAKTENEGWVLLFELVKGIGVVSAVH